MKKIFVLGIGAGNPEWLTIQAVNALNQVDVFFILDKGADKEKLTDFRREVCQRYITDRDYRIVDATSPDWDRDNSAYRSTITALNDDKQAVFEHLIGEKMADGECGAFLVWGDPTLYDSTIRILQTIQNAGTHAFEFDVIPGISAAQGLAARHKIPLNRIGGSVAFTTGRRISDDLPQDADSVVVMLDSKNRFSRYTDQDIDIYWGAYIGTPDEILVAGKLKDVAADIERLRAEARQENGWIMDTYLMRRNDPQDS